MNDSLTGLVGAVKTLKVNVVKLESYLEDRELLDIDSEQLIKHMDLIKVTLGFVELNKEYLDEDINKAVDLLFNPKEKVICND